MESGDRGEYLEMTGMFSILNQYSHVADTRFYYVTGLKNKRLSILVLSRDSTST